MSQDKIQKARELVLNYIATHTLSDKLNRAVNEVCRSRPKDPWLLLSDIISEWSNDVPMIDRLVPKHGIDCYGKVSLQLQLFGRVSSTRPPRFLGMENVFIINNDDIDDSKRRNEGLIADSESMMKKVSEFLSPALRSIRINEQRKIDDELSKLYKDGLQTESISFNIIPTISSLIAVNAAKHLNMALFRYLTLLRRNALNETENDDDIKNVLPNIMCELIRSASFTNPSICLVTKNSLKPMERITMINDITHQLIEDIEYVKHITFDSNNGSIIINEDTDIGELLGFIKSAINKTKYEIIRDVSLCLSFTSRKSYNDDMIEYLYDLSCDHKEIEYLEDPLPLNDTNKEMYNLLRNKMANNIKIIGNGLYSSMIESIQNGIKCELTSGVAISTKEMFTISNALTISNMIQELSNNKMELSLLCDNDSDNAMNTYSVDLSIAINAKILRLSLPNCGKSTNKYNRWLFIAEELSNDAPNTDSNTVKTDDLP